MIPVGERDASVVRKRAKSGAIIAALGAICGLGYRVVKPELHPGAQCPLPLGFVRRV